MTGSRSCSVEDDANKASRMNSVVLTLYAFRHSTRHRIPVVSLILHISVDRYILCFSVVRCFLLLRIGTTVNQYFACMAVDYMLGSLGCSCIHGPQSIDVVEFCLFPDIWIETDRPMVLFPHSVLYENIGGNFPIYPFTNNPAAALEWAALEADQFFLVATRSYWYPSS